MTRGPEGPPVAPPPAGDAQAVATLLDEFLDGTSRHKAPRTYAWYRENIQRFLDGIPPTLTVAELKPFHVTQAFDRFQNWSNNTQHDVIGAIKTHRNDRLGGSVIYGFSTLSLYGGKVAGGGAILPSFYTL